MDAAQALSDLTEISSQIEAAVILDGNGAIVASTLADGDISARVADAARALLSAAEARPEVREGLVQLEVATHEGSVFVVREGGRAVVATTTPEPTVGLVFYDLKSCLRATEAPAEPEAKPRPRSRSTTKKGADAA